MKQEYKNELKKASDHYHSEVRSSGKYVKTGKGNLLPLICESKVDYSLIIIDTKADQEPFSKATPEEQVERLTMDKSEPLFAFYFPKTEGGLSSVNAIIEWLEEIKDYLEEEK
ncbi:hypothetical protein [Enterococcus termitis]|uniref:Uncharacterized protein n=1 Tax=Enterococcus termitis TaxID=332950 RepID=A0A1E5GIF2_9ENTE|nr:hypothetical protein [Enterococcus termitis]OEG12482.1 hypothetical protein BCR25_08065 [Enterococcus termitis]